jgi:hypothetical protein
VERWGRALDVAFRNRALLGATVGEIFAPQQPALDLDAPVSSGLISAEGPFAVQLFSLIHMRRGLGLC